MILKQQNKVISILFGQIYNKVIGFNSERLFYQHPNFEQIILVRTLMIRPELTSKKYTEVSVTNYFELFQNL